MLLPELEIQKKYRSNQNHMLKDFYNPVLSTAVKYKRAVGYFTLASLLNVSQGLYNLIENGGCLEIIASPVLSEEDVNTIKLGYRMKEDVILDAMIRELNDIHSEKDAEKLNYIATLIADDRLKFKIALMNDYGAYHEKFGIVEDGAGNKIAFIGSMNETYNGQYSNFESFVVFKSWDENQKIYINEFESDFENLWGNSTFKLEVIDFPEAVKNRLLEYKKETVKKLDIECDKNSEIVINEDYEEPQLPEWFKPRPYQIDAIRKWEENNFNGLLCMATGTGKTLTGLYGFTELWNKVKKLVTIIVCPYQHLVEQWAEDVRKFNIYPIICYSTYEWKSKLFRKINMVNFGTINNFTIITMNETFVTEDMQNFINQINSDKLLIIDEAHNSGTNTMQRCLDGRFKYRLGLSATPKRYRDEETTDKIYKYFGGEVYNFDLKRAIDENYLTKYYYYPKIIELTEEEQEEYDEISLKIAQNIKEENGKIIINDIVKNLLIKRSRLVAGATNKLELLRFLMKTYNEKNYILVYCGATKVNDDDNEERQISKVCKILGKEHEMKIRKFTSAESAEERQEIIEMFSDGKSLQAIVAIKCLDEGVNIPAIQHAFIMASTSDPKEFIQRRGRVLRKFKGKEYAYIYDFVTIPSNRSKSSKSLVETELKRVYEFNSLAENKTENEFIINELIDEFDIEEEKIQNVIDDLEVRSLDDE